MSVGGRRLIGLLACGALMVAVLGLQAPAAGADVRFAFDRSFGPDGSDSTAFVTAGSVAVDRVDGLVYVLDREGDALFKFDLEGNPVDFGGSSPDVSGNELSGLSVGGGAASGGRQVAVNSNTHVIYLTGAEDAEGNATALQAFHSNGDPALFTAGPGAGTNEIAGLPGIRGVAVDTNGSIYVSGTESTPVISNQVSVYSATGELLLEDLGVDVQGPYNLAVDTNGVLYAMRNRIEVVRYTPSVYPVTPATTYVAAPQKVDPNFAKSIAIDPATNRLFVLEDFEDDGTQVSRVAVFSEDGVLVATFGGPGEEGELDQVDGIGVGVDEEGMARIFVAHAPGGISQVEIFEEELVVDAPTIQRLFTAGVTADSAILRARINPNFRATTYRFEYGTEDCGLSPCTPLGSKLIGAGGDGVAVTEAIAGLQPGSTYHYRVVAENSEGSREARGTFTTQGFGVGFALGDSRVWEIVSPPKKAGGAILNTSVTAVQASVSGNGFVYASRGSILGQPSGNQLPSAATLLAKRDETGRWVSRDLTPPHTTSSELRNDTEFNLFSPDLLKGEIEPSDNTPLSSEASEQTPYLWSDADSPALEPLLTPANVPPGTKFGSNPDGSGVYNPVRIEGANTSLSHVVISSDSASLVEGAAPGSIYLWAAGELEAVSELPASEGGVVVGILGSGRGTVKHAISSDGSRVFWAPGISYNAAGIGLPALYLRDTVAGESVRLDVLAGGTGLGEARPAFNGASADGSVVFFTDSRQLTADASPEGRDLYRCEIGPVEGGLGCAELTDISAPLSGSGESAEVFDQVAGMSEDGTRVYFVAEAVLDETANQEGDVAEGGQPNLYLWQEGEGARFIAQLSEQDHLVWGGTLGTPHTLGFAVRISAAASPSGRYFSFTSQASLTGYENRNASDEPSTEVFVFDAEAGDDPLACISCNPTGAAAVGERVSAGLFFPPDPGGLWNGRWVAATLPQASHTQVEGRSLYRPRSVLNNGRVFFNSVDPLVPADSNGNWDVYQHEPLGVGSCHSQTGAAAMVRSGSGCVGLLSSGTSPGDSGFLDATPSGDDVFFLTRGKLSVLDEDEEVDVYDARVNGIPAVLEPVRECAGEACQPVVGPPNDPTPASESFRGAGKSLQCRKGQRKARRNGKAVCVRKKRAKNGKHRKKQAAKSGRARR